ncbi:MAG TPA: dihydrolipoyl dehydrogenase [Acidimicrobiales bacterium]|nr:dihydrolipoyl dehydrogenase [Acidimicrobiales bacterium]HLN42338.1 dihydrolipoyl dehydrogenase [Acidimicrobiales bacterium]
MKMEVITTPEATEFDVVVIGGGPGGYSTALYGASAGLRVAVVEHDKVGGTCLHRGCVPAKEFLETASVVRTVAGAKEFGVQAGQPVVDFAVSQGRKQKVVDQLFKGLAGLMKGRGIVTFDGTGTLLPDHRVRVEPNPGAEGGAFEITGRNVVLATGSAPRTIPGFDVDGRLVLTSDEVLSLEALPASLAVIGGGAIGCEFASMFSDLGCQVTVLEALPTLLTGCDKDVVAVVARSFRKRGITVHTGVKVTGHTPNGAGTTVSFGDGESVTVDAVVVSVGRRPLSERLLADGTGVTVDDRGFVTVDEYQRTTADGVWAVGDVVDTPQLAHVGFAEGILAIKTMLGEAALPVEYSRVPWAIYCHPEVAFAGLTEAQAEEAGIDVVVKKDPFGGNSRARILGETDGLVKVVAERLPDGRAGRILGVHMVGPWVTEQLGQGYLAVNWEATPEEVGQFIQPHPSLSEAFGETVLALTGRGLHVG